MIYDEISKYSVTQIDDVLRYARKPNFKLNEVDSAM